MSEQAITQEQLFLPLLYFLADHGGEIDRERDNLLPALADRLGLTVEEQTRPTETGDRNQWRSTVEFSRLKLKELHDSIDPDTPYGIWRLSEQGRRLVRDPPPEFVENFEVWRRERQGARPADAPEPPQRPSGHFEPRLEQLSETPTWELGETLRVSRNGALARALKEEYDYRCQICDPDDPDCPEIPMVAGRRYVEVHHIEGLAEVALKAEHGQLDDSEYVNLTSYHNVIVVCPFHHRLVHHHELPFEFNRQSFSFVTSDRSLSVPVVVRHSPHLEGR